MQFQSPESEKVGKGVWCLLSIDDYRLSVLSTVYCTVLQPLFSFVRVVIKTDWSKHLCAPSTMYTPYID